MGAKAVVVACGLYAASLFLDRAGIADFFPSLDSHPLLLNATMGAGAILTAVAAIAGYATGYPTWSPMTRALLAFPALLPVAWYGSIVVLTWDAISVPAWP